MARKHRNWYPLDNAANIYPVIQTKSWTSMFRFTALMDEMVDTKALQQALCRMRGRFPGFYMCLRRGVFWYYMEETDMEAIVEWDTLYPCPPVERGQLHFRIKVHNNRISAEFSHIICDGAGAIAYFKTLLAEYLRERGAEIPNEKGILDISATPEKEEMADSFLHYYRTGARPSRSEPFAYKVRGTRLLPGMTYITSGELSLEAALNLARRYKVSLTEYMTASLIYVLYNLQKAERPKGTLMPVKVSVPVNLRKYYPTKTLRNFSQYLNPGIDPKYGDFTFEETLQQVHHYFRYMFTEKNLNARMSLNVGAERNLALRVVPLFIKKLGVRLVYETTGETVFTSVLSNVGAFDMPEEMARHVRRCDVTLCTAKYNAVSCGMMSCGDVLSITFSRRITEPYVERMFFTSLVRQGLHVKVESNQLSWDSPTEFV